MNAETVNDTSYQSVSCSADAGRPRPQISWLVGGLPPSDYPFVVNVSEALHSNGTSSLSSILRFPTHLQDNDMVTCVVQHPALPNPEVTAVRVETYGKCTFTAALCTSVVRRCCIISWRVAIKHHDSASCNTVTFPCCSFSLCSTYTLTDHKSHYTVQHIHVGMQSFSEV